MVGSPFILLDKNGRRTLLNIQQITSVSDEDVRLDKANRKRYSEVSAEQKVVYIIDVQLASMRFIEFLYERKEDRDAMLDKLIAAISPGFILDSPPGLPMTWPDIAQIEPEEGPEEKEPTERLYKKDEVFCTQEEFQRAVAQTIEAAKREWEQNNQAPPKPPRTPRKPKE